VLILSEFNSLRSHVNAPYNSLHVRSPIVVVICSNSRMIVCGCLQFSSIKAVFLYRGLFPPTWPPLVHSITVLPLAARSVYLQCRCLLFSVAARVLSVFCFCPAVKWAVLYRRINCKKKLVFLFPINCQFAFSTPLWMRAFPPKETSFLFRSCQYWRKRLSPTCLQQWK
jgi:hypothetical protein